MATMKEPQTELSEKNQTLGKKFGFWSVIGILICCSGAVRISHSTIRCPLEIHAIVRRGSYILLVGGLNCFTCPVPPWWQFCRTLMGLGGRLIWNAFPLGFPCRNG